MFNRPWFYRRVGVGCWHDVYCFFSLRLRQNFGHLHAALSSLESLLYLCPRFQVLVLTTCHAGLFATVESFSLDNEANEQHSVYIVRKLGIH